MSIMLSFSGMINVVDIIRYLFMSINPWEQTVSYYQNYCDFLCTSEHRKDQYKLVWSIINQSS